MENFAIGVMAAMVTIIWILVEAMVSIAEMAFSLKEMLKSGVRIDFHGKYRWQHLPMSFLNNWAVSIGGLIIFPIINGLIVGALPMLQSLRYLVCFILGLVFSNIIYWAWWGHDENLGHIFKEWKALLALSRNVFLPDVTRAGHVHFWFMSTQIGVLLLYVFTPMPQGVIFLVSQLLTVFVLVQNFQAVVIQRAPSLKMFLTFLAEFSVIWIMALVKLLIAAGHVIMI